jgi:hypothetical protein
MLVKTVALPVVCFGVAVVVWLCLLFVVCSWESAAVVMLLSLLPVWEHGMATRDCFLCLSRVLLVANVRAGHQLLRLEC